MSMSIGIDVGGTKIAGGLVDEDGRIAASTRRPTPFSDVEAAVEVICDIVADLVASAEREALGRPSTVGIGVAGFVDRARRRVMFNANLGWPEVALADLVEKRSGLAVIVENDANVAGWGEYRFGSGAARAREVEAADAVDPANMVCVTVGTGIGGGIVMGGRLHRGAFGAAAEVGHLQLVPDGLLCGCGRCGCWEQYGSGNALVRTARELAASRRGEASAMLALGDGTPEGVEGAHVTTAAQQGDPVAVAAFARTGTWVGRGLAQLAAILDPAVFVIGGGVADAGELLLKPARAAFAEDLVAVEHRPLAAIVPAQLGNDAGIVGAADLARDSI